MHSPDLSGSCWSFSGHEHARAIQMFGGSDVRMGANGEALHRQIRALRIYEGDGEEQKLIAREMLRVRETNFQQAAE